MIFLGIDPSVNSTGWAVILQDKQKKISLLEFGSFVFKPGGDIMEKIKTIIAGIDVILLKHKIDECAIEETLVNKNPSSSLKLGLIRGCCISSVLSKNIKVFEYKPSSIKLNITGSGKSDKKQIEYMVKAILNQNSLVFKNDDESDAVAVAIAHSSYRSK